MKKAAGWKIALKFCAAPAVLALLLWLAAPPRPAHIAPGLLELSQKRASDFSSPQGKIWKKRLDDAANGYGPREKRDSRLASLTHDALLMHRLDAAGAAVSMIGQAAVKHDLLRRIFEEALKVCESLPWAAYALTDLTRYSPARDLGDLAGELEGRRELCPR